VEVKYPASTAENELQVAVTYRIWIPDGVSNLRGIIVHQHGAGTTASNVRVSSKGDRGVEITWSAEADFESGIRGFVVLRDGQELANVPEKPVGKFGRPLFQSMTYHDTPNQPMPEMRFLDSSAKSDEKHIYSVVTVNSVGLKSEPSANSINQHEEER
jgi:hypothetical protein